MIAFSFLAPGTKFRFPNGSYPALVIELANEKKAVYLHSGKQVSINKDSMVETLDMRVVRRVPARTQRV